MRLLPILAASCFVSSMSMRIVDPVVPELARDLAVTTASAALLASVFTFPYALGQPLLGALGDSLGKARIIKLTLSVLVVSLVVSALATSINVLYAARIVGGAAAGGIIPLAFAMVGDRFDFANRQVALSRLLTAIIAGQLTGSVGSGFVASLWGWRVSMGCAAIIAAFAFVLTVALLTARPNAERQSFSVARIRAAYRDVFANRQSWICFPAVFAEGILIFGLFPYVAVLLEARGAGGIREAGFVLAGFGIGGLIYTATVKSMLRTIGVNNLMRWGSVLAGFGFALLTAKVTWPVELAVFVIVGVGFYMIHNSLQTFATELSVANRGASVAAHAFFFFLGQAVGPVIYGAGFAAVGATQTLLVAAACFAVLGVATVLGLTWAAGKQRNA